MCANGGRHGARTRNPLSEHRCSKAAANHSLTFRGHGRTRTCGHLRVIQVLYQLSYTTIVHLSHVSYINIGFWVYTEAVQVVAHTCFKIKYR